MNDQDLMFLPAHRQRQMIVDGETWHGRAGMGRYLARGPSGQVG